MACNDVLFSALVYVLSNIFLISDEFSNKILPFIVQILSLFYFFFFHNSKIGIHIYFEALIFCHHEYCNIYDVSESLYIEEIYSCVMKVYMVVEFNLLFIKEMEDKRVV